MTPAVSKRRHGSANARKLRRVYLFAHQYVDELRGLERSAQGDVAASVREALELAIKARDVVDWITRQVEEVEDE